MSLLTACSTSRYEDKHDSIPTRLPDTSELNDAIARAEPHSRGGNKDYQVRGINYSVLNSAQGFEQTGIASWYGNKFHGHLTSNGEVYDMYAMSAAHKNLPLPSYLKVTNLTNNKSVVVRVNDRGPFHEGRIIDLSYSAAYKLGMLKAGTAKVKITAITEFDDTEKFGDTQLDKTQLNDIKLGNANPDEAESSVSDLDEAKPDNSIIATSTPVTSPSPSGATIASHLLAKNVTKEKSYIQVFATSKHALAQKIVNIIKKKHAQNVYFKEENGIYRVQIGPISSTITLNNLLAELKQGDYPNAYQRSL